METKDHGLVESWLRNIRDVHRLHHSELKEIVSKDERARRLVELNVIEQCLLTLTLIGGDLLSLT